MATAAPPRKNLCAPRAARSDTEIGRLVRALEVECCRDETLDCDDEEAPCWHCADADHGLACDEWAELLLAFDPRGYADLPPDPRGGDVLLSHEDRLARYELRVRDGHAPTHPDDRLADERISALGMAGRHDVRAQSDGLDVAGEERVVADEGPLAGWVPFRPRVAGGTP